MSNEGFREEYFADLAGLEAGHSWFRVRNKLVVWALRRYAPGFTSFLEVGCGTGFVLSGIEAAFPHAVLTGSEMFGAGLSFAAARVRTASFVQVDARNMPFEQQFDVIGAFDVLEHIREDEAVLAEMHRALKPGGHLLITVPQHQWLWSPLDAYACHVRRYAASELHEKLGRARFEIVHSTSFVFTSLPAMLLSRFTQRRMPNNFDPTAELRIKPWMNRILEVLLGMDLQLIRSGISLPFGGSRLVMARRL